MGLWGSSRAYSWSSFAHFLTSQGTDEPPEADAPWGPWPLARTEISHPSPLRCRSLLLSSLQRFCLRRYRIRSCRTQAAWATAAAWGAPPSLRSSSSTMDRAASKADRPPPSSPTMRTTWGGGPRSPPQPPAGVTRGAPGPSPSTKSRRRSGPLRRSPAFFPASRRREGIRPALPPPHPGRRWRRRRLRRGTSRSGGGGGGRQRPRRPRAMTDPSRALPVAWVHVENWEVRGYSSRIHPDCR